jgi:hypothetical protein
MKKFPSFPSLNNLKDLSTIKDDVSTKIFYSTFVNKITDEFIEDAPYNIFTNFQSTLDENTFLNTITYGNVTSCIGMSTSFFGENHHVNNIILFLLLYFIWFKFQNWGCLNNQKITFLSKTTSDKPDNPIDVKTINKNTNLFVLIIFIILTRNVDNAI